MTNDPRPVLPEDLARTQDAAYQTLRRDAVRWRFYGVAALGSILLVAYLARSVAAQNENVQLAGGLAILALMATAIYCFGKSAAKGVSARAALSDQNKAR
jgi:predicted anti-sigma-YlaC factor YlaD